MYPMHINHNLYRYTEQALRDYPDECRRLKLLEEYLCAPAGPSDSGFIMGGESIPEQERILERKFKNEELRGLAIKIACIQSFWDALGVADRALIQLRYFNQLTWRQVADELHVSEQACRCRWAPRLIGRAAKLIFGDLVKV